MSDYEQQLGKTLESARKRLRQGREMKTLKSAAPTLFEIIDAEISLEVNRGYGDKPLSYEEYLESHGAHRGIRRIRNLINAKEADEVMASQEVAAIEGNLEQIKNDQKRK